MRVLAPILLTICGLTPLLRATALDPRQLPAEACWFIHVDVDAANASAVGKSIRDAWLARPEGSQAIEKAREVIGIDPVHDIHGITVYGTSYAPDNGVAVIRGKVDRQKLVGLIKNMPGYRVETTGSREIHYWTEGGQPGGHDADRPAKTSAGAFFGDDTVVIGPGGKPVIAALDVLEGKSPALAKDSPLAVPATEGSIVQAAAAGLADAKNLPLNSPVLRQCEYGTLSVGEQNGDVFVHGKIVTKSADVASKIRALVEGAKAMAVLQSDENFDAAKLLGPLKVVADEKTVNLDWTFPAAEVVKCIEAEEAKLPSPKNEPGGKGQ
ncbi:MAG: hypothetical protein JWL69_3723 [Phycisphaerales bacterium]|nr:hypothetical protein [Phycisphaerales bacterium]MDB5354965.1 hypothetical protein [Phycisphaerales bacterium]